MPEPSEPLRVVLVDDHPLYRQGLARLLVDAGIDVVAEAGNGIEAISAVEQHAPDVVVVAGIQAAAAGESLISPRIASMLLRRVRAWPSREAEAPTPALSERELQVLQLVAEGKANHEIGEALFIGPSTVRNHIASILMKVQVENRVQAAVRAVRTASCRRTQAAGAYSRASRHVGGPAHREGRNRRSVVAIALPASAAAQPQQEGLVNVNVSDNVVQVPIGVAANICGVGVGVLVSEIDTGPVNCTTTAESDAVSVDSGDGGDTQQQGLVNVNVEDNTLQVPLTIAANVCGVGVGILAQDIDTGPVECDARSRARARAKQNANRRWGRTSAVPSCNARARAGGRHATAHGPRAAGSDRAYHLLAEGRPVAPERPAERTGLHDEVTRLLESWPASTSTGPPSSGSRPGSRPDAAPPPPRWPGAAGPVRLGDSLPPSRSGGRPWPSGAPHHRRAARAGGHPGLRRP